MSIVGSPLPWSPPGAPSPPAGGPLPGGQAASADPTGPVDEVRLGNPLIYGPAAVAALDGAGTVRGQGGPVDKLITGWNQTSEGNCVSVATIKLAMAEWGSDKVFLSQRKDKKGNWHITMRDGTEVTVTAKELKTATRMSRFQGDDKRTLRQANLCYAAMAKRALAEGHEGARTFSRACHSLNDGELTEPPVRFLGISEYLTPVKMEDLPSQDHYMAGNLDHMVFGGKDRTDAWGEVVPLESWATESSGGAMYEAWTLDEPVRQGGVGGGGGGSW